MNESDRKVVKETIDFVLAETKKMLEEKFKDSASAEGIKKALLDSLPEKQYLSKEDVPNVFFDGNTQIFFDPNIAYHFLEEWFEYYKEHKENIDNDLIDVSMIPTWWLYRMKSFGEELDFWREHHPDAEFIKYDLKDVTYGLKRECNYQYDLDALNEIKFYFHQKFKDGASLFYRKSFFGELPFNYKDFDLGWINPNGDIFKNMIASSIIGSKIFYEMGVIKKPKESENQVEYLLEMMKYENVERLVNYLIDITNFGPTYTAYCLKYYDITINALGDTHFEEVGKYYKRDVEKIDSIIEKIYRFLQMIYSVYLYGDVLSEQGFFKTSIDKEPEKRYSDHHYFIDYSSRVKELIENNKEVIELLSLFRLNMPTIFINNQLMNQVHIYTKIGMMENTLRNEFTLALKNSGEVMNKKLIPLIRNMHSHPDPEEFYKKAKKLVESFKDVLLANHYKHEKEAYFSEPRKYHLTNSPYLEPPV